MRRKTGGSYRKTRGNSVSTSGGRASRPGAALIQQVFNKETFREEFSIMMKELKSCLKDVSPLKEGDDIQTKIDSLNSIDFSRDNKLPNLNKDTLEQYGFEDKPVILKKNIIEKNKTNHPDITDDMAREIIGNSLYKPEAVLKANKEKPAYHNFITRLDDDKNSIVLLELSEEKDNYEIVNYHYLDDYGVRKKEKKDINIRS